MLIIASRNAEKRMIDFPAASHPDRDTAKSVSNHKKNENQLPPEALH